MRLLPVLLTTALLAASPAVQALEIVTSIRPLQLITESLLIEGDSARPLLPGNASPHDFQLRPSDLRALQGADLVVWVGPALESFLTKPLANLETTQVLQLHGDEGAEGHDAHAADKHDAHRHEHAHDHGHAAGEDPHLWLDPMAAVEIAEAIGHALIELNPQRGDAYRARLARFRDQVLATDQALRQQLAPLGDRGYFVFHDGYRHFEEHYGLKHLGAFTLSPERPPGARHLHRIRQRLQQPDAVCVFAEPQYRPAVIDAVTEGLAVRLGTLDPLGGSATDYLALLRAMGDAFADCLGSAR